MSFSVPRKKGAASAGEAQGGGAGAPGWARGAGGEAKQTSTRAAALFRKHTQLCVHTGVDRIHAHVYIAAIHVYAHTHVYM